MIDDNLWFHLLAGAIMLIYGIRAGVIFFRYRTKYNLATLFVITALFIGIVLSYFHPGRLNTILASLGIGTTVQIILVGIFTSLLLVFFFYLDIKRFLNRRKTRNE